MNDNFELIGYLKALEIDQIGTNNVCVDPRNPDIMYAGCSSNYYFDLKAVWRSLDGGKNWTLLTRQKDDGREGPDGGKKPICMRVNAKTGELFTFNGCRGVWKMPAPPDVYEHISSTSDFKVEISHLEFIGLCKECAEAE